MKTLSKMLILPVILIALIHFGSTGAYFTDSDSVLGNSLTAGYWVTPEVPNLLNLNVNNDTDNVEPSITPTEEPTIEPTQTPTPTPTISLESNFNLEITPTIEL